jgi:cytidylate kinase
VICISRVTGAGGGEVGRMVADSLGYRLVDEEIIQQAAASGGVSVEELADTERRRKFVEGLVRNLAVGGSAASLMHGGTGVVDLGSGADPKSLRALIQKSIHETAEQGDVVIVSHAASYALTGAEDVLRVLVTASPETRAGRLAQDESVDDKRATRAIADSDAQRAAYLKRFYSVGDELPTHYDLSLNSDSLTTQLMSELVVRAASSA